jgi:hypothetical protein
MPVPCLYHIITPFWIIQKTQGNTVKGALMQKEIEAEWISYEEAQHLTSLGRTTLWRICNTEGAGIEVARVGRAVRINRASLMAYMKRSAGDVVQRP